MSYNYDASQVGVPYVRASRILIGYPDNNRIPSADIEQTLVVKLADGTIRELEKLPSLNVPLDMLNHGADAIPMVNPADGSPLGANTNLNTAMVHVLAVVRAAQLAQNP